MTIDELRERKRAMGLTNQMIADMSGVPLGTVQKIFAGITKSPQWATLQALEDILGEGSDQETDYLKISDTDRKMMVTEPALHYADPKQGSYTIDDYYAIPDERRVELIDGVIYDMTAPASLHQLIMLQLHLQLAPCVEAHPECEIFLAPCDVHLDRDKWTMVQPDIFIVCDSSQINRKRIEGAPDFVIEVLSPSTRSKDMYLKLQKYKYAGVREYWLVDLKSKYVLVHDLVNDTPQKLYPFKGKIPVLISNGECEIDFDRIYSRLEKYFLMEDEKEKAEDSR